MTADQTTGTAPNSRMVATPGVTKAHPVKCSELVTRARALAAALSRRRRSEASDAATSLIRVGENLVDLLGGAVQRGRGLALAEQHRDDHGAEYLGDLRVGRDLRPGLPDIAEVLDEGVHPGERVVHAGLESGGVG